MSHQLSESNPRIPPIARGDWVATLEDDRFIVGKVGEVWWDDRLGWLFNLSIYDVNGGRIGRESDACGGPGNFEPAITYTGQYRRIEKPDFPLKQTLATPSRDNGDGTFTQTLAYSYHPSVTTKPERTQVRAPKPTVEEITAHISDYDPKLEAAARRMAAQSMRDVARTMEPGEALDAMRAQIETLEDEADEHQAEDMRMTDANIARWSSERRRSERLARALRASDKLIRKRAYGKV